MQRGKVQSLVRELRSHMACGQKKQNTNNRRNISTNSIKTKNGSHKKKSLQKRL